MRWIWNLEAGAYVLRPEAPPDGTSELGFVGRALRPGIPGPLDGRPLVRLGQVHGARVVHCGRPGSIPECDGAVTGEGGVLLTVRTADCLPVLLSSARGGIALLHAGWRGLLEGILEAGVAELTAPGDLHAVLGPAIGVCCYEVGPEVAARFPAEALDRSRGERPHVDLGRAAARRLVALGIPPERIDVIPVCTRCHQHLLHSSRGSGAAPGRITAFAAAGSVG